jgi:putative transposase
MDQRQRGDRAGYIYHVLNRANAKVEIFKREKDYEAFLRIIEESLEKTPLNIFSFCIMPNHWHFVLRTQEDGDMGRFIQRLTISHAKRWHAAHQTTGAGHLYQGRYKSFPIQNDSHFLTVCRYVERNPLRAKLVEGVQDWKWSSLWIREKGNQEQKKILAPWPVEMVPNHLEWVNQPLTSAEEADINGCMKRNRPYGSLAWSFESSKNLGLEHTLRPLGRPKQ